MSSNQIIETEEVVVEDVEALLTAAEADFKTVAASLDAAIKGLKALGKRVKKEGREDILVSNKKPIEHLVTPISPYFLCNHFISTEVHNANPRKYIGIALEFKANDLLKNKNYDDIQEYDIIQIQVNHFNFFHDRILPIIQKKKIKVIIITSQLHLPQIHRSYKTDKVLHSPNILLWISQNPIYTENKKYMAFPYGMYHHKVNEYVEFIKSNDINTAKTIKIVNPNLYLQTHLKQIVPFQVPWMHPVMLQ
jgi:hypothetical protein